MSSFRRVFAFLFICLLFSSASVYSANRVVVESKTIGVNAPTSIGVYTENDGALEAFVLPLVFRGVAGAAYPPSITAYVNPAGRLPMGPGAPFTLIMAYDVEDGSCQGGTGGFGTDTGSDDYGPVTIDPASDPDAFRLTLYNVFPPTPMSPGSDFPIGSTEPSFLFYTGGVSNPGQFVVDTTCMDPAAHLLFVETGGVPVSVDFTRGVIDVTSCECPHQADIDANGQYDNVDLNLLIQILWFNGPNPRDTACPTWRSDVNADGFPDAVDFQRLAEILYYNGGPSCNPCDPIQDLCLY